MPADGLAVLAVANDASALAELVLVLGDVRAVAAVDTAVTAAEALHLIRDTAYDGVVMDVGLPGLDGTGLARVVGGCPDPPEIVFVAARDGPASNTFEVHAVSHLLMRPGGGWLLDALQRVTSRQTGPRRDFETIPVERAGRTLMLPRADVLWAEAAGDYVRLHTRQEPGHLVRLPIGLLADRWCPYGFARIHRSYLVSLAAVRELQRVGTQTVASVNGLRLPVSRRHQHELRERLTRVRVAAGRPDANRSSHHTDRSAQSSAVRCPSSG